MKLRFVPVEDRPFLTLDAAHDGSLDAIITDYDLKDAVVRFRYTVTEEDARRIDQGEYRRMLTDAGAHKVAIHQTVVREERARVAEMTDELSAEQAFELWLDTQSDMYPAETKEALRVLHAEYVERSSD